MGVVVLLHEVPFVDDDDDALVVALGEGEDVQVLLFEPLAGVEHEYAHVGGLDGAYRPHDGVELDVLRHLALAAQSGGVDEVEVESEEVVPGVDGVAGGAGYGGHDGALLAGDGVYEGALADVGAPHDGYSRQSVCRVFLAFGEVFDEGVQQVAGTAARDAGDRVGVAEAEAVEFRKGLHLGGVVHLVHSQHDGFGTAAEHVGHVFVHRGEPFAGVAEEEYYVGFVDGKGHLFAYFLFELVVAPHHVASGVYDGEVFPVPVRVAVLPVAGDAAGGVDYCVAGLGEAVEEGGLAHVGAAYDCDYVHSVVVSFSIRVFHRRFR